MSFANRGDSVTDARAFLSLFDSSSAHGSRRRLWKARQRDAGRTSNEAARGTTGACIPKDTAATGTKGPSLYHSQRIGSPRGSQISDPQPSVRQFSTWLTSEYSSQVTRRDERSSSVTTAPSCFFANVNHQFLEPLSEGLIGRIAQLFKYHSSSSLTAS